MPEYSLQEKSLNALQVKNTQLKQQVNALIQMISQEKDEKQKLKYTKSHEPRVECPSYQQKKLLLREYEELKQEYNNIMADKQEIQKIDGIVNTLDISEFVKWANIVMNIPNEPKAIFLLCYACSQLYIFYKRRPIFKTNVRA